jgi:aspartate-semialdehyde dehydrogenase
MISGREPKVAVVGATGAVGNQVVELLETRAFPRGELRLFASASGAAETVAIDERQFEVEELQDPGELRSFDLVFLALPEARASEIIQATPGPLLIDLSGASRAPSGQPMVAPGVTPRERLNALRGEKVFEIPHPAAHALATILGTLGVRTGFAGATLLTGASAGGRARVTETAEQSADLLSGRLDLPEGAIQRAFNALVTEHERQTAEIIRAQVGRLMEQSPNLVLQLISVPILHGSVLAVEVPASSEGEEWPARLRSAPGMLFVEDRKALGVIDALSQEAIAVRMEQQAAGAALFAVFDNARLAALIAIWIAETLLLTSH